MPTAPALLTSPPRPPAATAFIYSAMKRSPLFITLLFLSALAASVPLVRSALADGERAFPYRRVEGVETGFDPEKHMLPVGNDYKARKLEELPGSRSITSDGRCMGIIETAVSYYARYNGTSKPALREYGEQIRAKNQATDPNILDKVAENAQIFAIVRGRNRFAGSSREAAEQLAKDLKESKTPQLISLRAGRDGPGHAVAVYGYAVYKLGDQTFYDFNVADPNDPPGTPHSRMKKLTYVAGGNGPDGWVPFPSGNIEYNIIYLRHKPQEPPGYFEQLKSLLTGEEEEEEPPAFRDPIPGSQYYLKNLEMAEEGKTLPPPHLSMPKGRVDGMAVTRDEVGGVLVQFDPVAFSKASAAEGAEIDRQVGEFLRSGRAGTLMIKGRGRREESFEFLSLRQWLASGDRTLGGLTRVRGYVAAGDDLLIVGQREPSMPAIDGDVLTVALAAVYQEGSTPFVSLDPNPSDFYGAQQVRVGGIPERFEQTEFVRIMLDADYDMKKIHLGETRLDVPGFQSWYDLLKASESAGAGVSRSWLTPVSTVGEVFEGGTAVVFESDVQVLTERMKDLRDYDPAPGQAREEDEQAVRLMTRHYPEIERRVPSFYQLHGLFDVTKLCAILRHKGVKNSALDAAAARTVRTVTHKRAYQGIGPKLVQGTYLVIGGGAVAKVRVSAGEFVQSAAVRGLAGGQKTIALERSLELQPSFNPEMFLGAAVEDYERGDLVGCVSNATQALEGDGELDEAYVYRALARAGLGETAGAVADLDYVVERMPAVLPIRGVVKLYAGDVEGANADVDEAVRKFPDDERVWHLNATVKVYSLDFVGAQAALERLFRLNGMSLEAHTLKATALMLGRMSPDDARLYVERALHFPIPLAEAFWNGYAATLSYDPSAAKNSYAYALELAEAQASNPHVKELSAVERALFLLAVNSARDAALPPEFGAGGDGTPQPEQVRRAQVRLEEARQELGSVEALWRERVYTKKDYEKQERVVEAANRDYEDARLSSQPAMRYAERLIAMRPDWASGHVAKGFCLLAAGGRAQQAKRLFDAAFTRTIDDPLIQEMELYYGRSVRPTFYALGYMLASRAPGGGPQDGAVFLGELAREQTPLGRMAAALLELEKAPARQSGDKTEEAKGKAGARLSDAARQTVKEALERKPGDDPAELILYSYMLMRYSVYGASEDPRQATQAARAVQLNLPQDPSTPQALATIGALRAQAFYNLGDTYRERARRAPELSPLVEAASRGELDAGELERRAESLTRALAKESRQLDPPAVARLLTEMYFTQIGYDLQREVLNQARQRIVNEAENRRATEGADVEPVPEELTDMSGEEAEAPADPSGEWLVAVDSATEEVTRKENAFWAGRGGNPFAVTDEAIAAASTPAELKFVESFFTQIFTFLQLRAAAEGGPEAVARVVAVQESMSGKIRLRGMRMLREVHLPSVSYRPKTWPSLFDAQHTRRGLWSRTTLVIALAGTTLLVFSALLLRRAKRRTKS